MYFQNNRFPDQLDVQNRITRRKSRVKLGTYRASLGLGPVPGFSPPPSAPLSTHKGNGSHRKTLSARFFTKKTPKSHRKTLSSNAYKENIVSPPSDKETARACPEVDSFEDKHFMKEDPDVTGVFVIEDLQSAKKQADIGKRSHQLNRGSNDMANRRWEVESRSGENVQTVSRNLMVKSPFCKQPLKDQNYRTDLNFTETSGSSTFKRGFLVKTPELSRPSLKYTKTFYYTKNHVSSPVEPVFKSFKPYRNFTVKPSTDESNDPLKDFKPGRKSVSVLDGSLDVLLDTSSERSSVSKNEIEESIKTEISKSEEAFERLCKMHNDDTMSLEIQDSPSFIIHTKNTSTMSVGGSSITCEQSESLMAHNVQEVESVSLVKERNSRRSRGSSLGRRSAAFLDFTVTPNVMCQDQAKGEKHASVVTEEKCSRKSIMDNRRSTALSDFPSAASRQESYKGISDENDKGTVVQDKYSSQVRSIVDKRRSTAFSDNTAAPCSNKDQTDKENGASSVKKEEYSRRSILEKRRSTALSDFTVAPLYKEESEEESGDRTIVEEETPRNRSVDKRRLSDRVLDFSTVPSSDIQKQEIDTVDTSKNVLKSKSVGNSIETDHFRAERTNGSRQSLIDGASNEISSQTSDSKQPNTSGDRGFSSEDEDDTVTFVYNESVCNETLPGDFTIHKNKKLSVISEEDGLPQLDTSRFSNPKCDEIINSRSKLLETSICDTVEKMSNCKKSSCTDKIVSKLNAILESHKVIVQKSEGFNKQRIEIMEKMRLEQNKFFVRQRELMASVQKREDEFVKEQNDHFIDIFDSISNLVSEISIGLFENSASDKDLAIIEDDELHSTMKSQKVDNSMLDNSMLCKTPTNVRQMRSNLVYSQLKSDFSCLKTPIPSAMKKTDILNNTLNRTILTPRSMSVCIQEQVNQLFDT